MGRTKNLNEIKRLKGTDQPCRMQTNSIELPLMQNVSKISDAKKLSVLKNKRAKDIFKDKANQLFAIGILSDLDFEQLAIYSNNLDQIFTCISELKKGMFVERFDENGNIVGFVQNPYLKLYKELININNKIANDFGFTPLSRQKFTSPQTEDKPTIEDILK
jgi:P27 family predicted phage terminase small subunit